MNSQAITKQTLAIYLEVAQNSLSIAPAISVRMLEAVSEIITDCVFKADPEQMMQCAELLILLRNHDLAETILSGIIRSHKTKSELGDWMLMRAYDGLAEVFLAQSKTNKAKRKSEQTLKIMAGINDVDKQLVTTRTRRLAMIHYQLGELDRASRLLNDLSCKV